MNSMKRKKDRTLRDELPMLGGVQHTTEEEQRNSRRKNEEVGPRWKGRSVVDVSDGERLWSCSQIWENTY